jgi:hypothetical protein
MSAALRGPTALWSALLVASVALVAAVETALLALGTGFLTNGYNTAHIEPRMLLLFLPGSALLDLALVLGIWSVAVPIAARLATSRMQAFCAVGLFGVGIPTGIAAALFGVYAVLGDLFNLTSASQASGLSSSAMVEQATFEIPGFAIVGALASATLIGCVYLLGRIPVRSPRLHAQLAPPPLHGLWLRAAIAVGLAIAIVAAGSATGSEMRYGFGRKVSGISARSLAKLLTDFDADGFGLLDRPADPAPFDAAIRPFAIDIPGNGIDENGVAGDHPAGFRPAPPGAPDFAGAAKPHLLILYLESFRAELLGMRVGDREVTPFFNRLVSEGAASSRAWVHAPWTLASRAQLFGGRLTNRPGQRTLIDDFKARGYRVAHFSGQDETYGDSVAVLGTERADVFYDARSDIDRRTSRSTAPVSLQVSWKTLHERVSEFLEDTPMDRPLLLYVNLVDTHFPYDHAEIDDLLGVPRLARQGIRAHRAREVFQAYANTAANVDLAAARVVADFRHAIGGADHGILVTADHGQAFYENGTLGHGQAIDDAQTRVPFIVWGIGGDWPEPIAPSDVRGLLARNLGVERGGDLPRARFRPDPERRFLQYASAIERPRFIALRGAHDALLYDLGRNRASVVKGDREVVGADPGDLLRPLVWTWEAAQREATR